ncbi:MAG: phytoene desaturase family protein [Chloroflexota bacterium]
MTSGEPAVVVGSGPNGLAAAIRLAQAGMPVTVIERAAAPGGGLRSVGDALKGSVLDHCASVFPLAIASPFLSTLPLGSHGLRWIHPPAPLAHPFDDGSAALLHRSLADTASGLGGDGIAWTRLFGPLAASAPALLDAILGPPRPGPDPVATARFAALGVLPAETLARGAFAGERARALFAGLAAHSFLRLDRPFSAAVGLVLGLCAHRDGWPLAEGGSQRLADALAAILEELGGAIRTGVQIDSPAMLPERGLTLLDTDPAQAAAIGGHRLTDACRRRLRRFRPGPGSFKIDYVLDGPVPWTAPECALAGTLHLGGSLQDIARGEWEVVTGKCPQRPFLLAGQPSRFDPSRAPAGRETFWVYCHVPRGATFDMTDRIEAQVERFAPGFRDRVLHRIVTTPAGFAAFNPNFPGGAIGGQLPGPGAALAAANPWRSPYATSDSGMFLCSASTPPGGGVHGMCGFHAAEAALRDHERERRP